MASSSKKSGYMEWIKFAIIVAFVPSVCFCYPTFGGQSNAGAGQNDYTVPPAYNVHQPPLIYPSKSQYTYGPAASSSIVYQQQQQQQTAQKPAALVYVDQPSPPVQYYQPGSEPQYAVGSGQYVAAASSTTEAPSGIWKFFSMPVFSIPDFFSKKPEEQQQQQQVPIPTYYVPAPGNAAAASDAYYNYAVLQHPAPKYPLYQVSAPNSAVVKPPSTYVNVNGRPSSSSSYYYSQPITSYLQRPNISAKVTSGKPTTTTPSSLSAQLPAYSIYLVPSKQQQQQQPQAAPLAVDLKEPSYNPYNYFQFPQQQPPNNYFNGYPQGNGFPWLAKAATTTGKPDCKDGRESATKGALESTTVKSQSSSTGPSTKATTISSTAFPKVHFIDDRMNDLEPTTGDRGLDDFAVTTPGAPKARNLLSANNNNNWVPLI